MRRLLVLETPWEDGLDSTMSVGPFLLGLRNALPLKIVSQLFNGRSDLHHFLREFSQPRSGFSHCYIASHGTRGRLQALIEDINAATISKACKRCPGRGFIVGACAFGHTKTAENFLKTTGAHFIAGYTEEVPWMESMMVDLLFLTYLFRGRGQTAPSGKSVRFRFRGDHPALTRSQNPVQVAKWVYEDLPFARNLGFVVHRRRPGKGRTVIEKYPEV